MAVVSIGFRTKRMRVFAEADVGLNVAEALGRDFVEALGWVGSREENAVRADEQDSARCPGVAGHDGARSSGVDGRDSGR